MYIRPIKFTTGNCFWILSLLYIRLRFRYQNILKACNFHKDIKCVFLVTGSILDIYKIL